MAATIGVVCCITEKVSSELLDKEMTCCWECGAAPARMGVRIPATASDRRAGYKVGERYDTGLLSSLLPTAEADTYTGRLIQGDSELIKHCHPEEKDYRPAAVFGHLGLVEPERP
ncbi:hypothetical protein ACIREK_05225 [Streptomyces sp. NPDC102415]|uniref:hypothetical protein n=1 Tax=Streptomyces sp. NPDC102415 TaxID=3366173 RepID=UPI0038121026